MIKSLEQINREFMEENNLIKKETAIKGENKWFSTYTKLKNALARLLQAIQAMLKRTRKTKRPATDILLYTAIVFILITALIFNAASNKSFSVFNFYAFTVLSKSMQSKIPEGSLVLVKGVDPDTIKIGDDITFIRKKDDTAVTHQVVNIFENYGESGAKGFQTRGVDNTDPDREVIYAQDIVGVVKYVIPGLGAVLHYISINIGFLLVILGTITILVVVIKTAKEANGHDEVVKSKEQP